MTINTEQWLYPVQRQAAFFVHAQPTAGGVVTFSSCRRASAAAQPPKLKPVGSTPHAGAFGS